jgi:hypothetical protein
MKLAKAKEKTRKTEINEKNNKITNLQKKKKY